MEIAENEMLFIYDSNDLQDREALAYAKSLKHYHVKALLDVRKHTSHRVAVGGNSGAIGNGA